MAEPFAERVRAWRRVLAPCPHLSERFRTRYAVMLAGLERQAPDAMGREARVLASRNPGSAARALLGRPEPSVLANDVDVRVTGSTQVASWLRRILDGRDAAAFFATQQPLRQTAVPLHPSRRACLIEAGHVGPPLVAVVWPASSLSARGRCMDAVRGLVEHANGRGGACRFRVLDEYALVWPSGDGNPWAVAENLGLTLEDELRFGRLQPEPRQRIVDGLRRLRGAMVETGKVWQGFAPRNMFWRDGEIVLIDFEEVVDAGEDPVGAAERWYWHRVFFADCLEPQEYEALFARDGHDPRVEDDEKLSADAFERALLGEEKVTWGQRRALLAQSVALEGRHRRPDVRRDGGQLFGHELGHFWGDFLPPADEARIFRALTASVGERVRVACLEVFEAAMEADIVRMLREEAMGAEEVDCHRTLALTDALDDTGSRAVADARSVVDGWYEQLETDPAGLVDGLLLRLGQHVPHLEPGDLERLLVGASSSRGQHTEQLLGAVETGLAFLHGDGRGDRFLHHAPPDTLRDLVGRPLPTDGASFDAVLAEVAAVIGRHSVSQAHPGYLAFPDSGNSVAALAGSVMSPLLNQNLIAVDRSAPVATFVEIQVIEWLRELVGYASAPLSALRGVRDVAGLWTTGGHLSNHVAMLTALGHRFSEIRERGLRGLDTQPTVIMAGPIAHYSHSDAAFHLGLGWNAVVSVAAQPTYTTDPAAVEAALRDPPAGTTPFMVVGVAGNCRTTGLDDLVSLADVCERYGVWFHADACHGGSLIFNERLRRRHLTGLERADSVSLDPHKGLFTPYPSSYVLFRDRGRLNHFSRHAKAVLEDGCWDLGLITPFLGSRGFASLTTWMLLRHVGVRKLGALVESRQALVRYLDRQLDETGLFVRLNEVDFYRLAFVFCPPPVRVLLAALPTQSRRDAASVVSAYTSRVSAALYEEGRACFDEHTLADLGNRVGLGEGTGYNVMACCPGNPLLTRRDLDAAVGRLTATARPLIPAMLAALAQPTQRNPQRPVAGPAGWNDQP